MSSKKLLFKTRSGHDSCRRSSSQKHSTKLQIRDSNLRFDISQHADDGYRALQSATSDILRSGSFERFFYDGIRARGDRQDNRSALSLFHGTMESLRLRPSISFDPRYPNGGHYDGFSGVPDALASREGVQNR